MRIITSMLTKSFVGLILLFSTFLTGLAVNLLWLKISPPVLSLCEVAKNPKQYQGKPLRLKAFVQATHGIFLFQDRNCNFGKFDAVIDLPEDYNPDSEQLRNFINKDNDKYLTTQMILTGEIDTTRMYEDYSPKFVIKATKIELTSEIIIKTENEQMWFLRDQQMKLQK